MSIYHSQTLNHILLNNPTYNKLTAFNSSQLLLFGNFFFKKIITSFLKKGKKSKVLYSLLDSLSLLKDSIKIFPDFLWRFVLHNKVKNNFFFIKFFKNYRNSVKIDSIFLKKDFLNEYNFNDTIITTKFKNKSIFIFNLKFNATWINVLWPNFNIFFFKTYVVNSVFTVFTNIQSQNYFYFKESKWNNNIVSSNNSKYSLASEYFIVFRKKLNLMNRSQAVIKKGIFYFINRTEITDISVIHRYTKNIINSKETFKFQHKPYFITVYKLVFDNNIFSFFEDFLGLVSSEKSLQIKKVKKKITGKVFNVDISLKSQFSKALSSFIFIKSLKSSIGKTAINSKILLEEFLKVSEFNHDLYSNTLERHRIVSENSWKITDFRWD